MVDNRNDINLSSNVTLRLIDRFGREVERHSHNIYLSYGHIWLLQLMSYKQGSGGAPAWETYTDNRVAYMGVGVGGIGQTESIPSPVEGDYPGTNNQTNKDRSITMLERPVRISESGGDIWLKEISSPPTFQTTTYPYSVTYSVVFASTEISYGSYTSVPLSEVGLFEKGQSGHVVQAKSEVYPAPGDRPQPIAYHTYASVEKTPDISVAIDWIIYLR